MVDSSNLSLLLGPELSITIDKINPDIVVTSVPLNLELKPYTESFTLTAGTKGSNDTTLNSPTVDVEIIAAQAMGLYRAVTILGIYCEPILESLSKYAGVTKTSVVLGSAVRVVQSGLMTDAGWTWTANAPIFIGVSGVLTQTPTALPVRRIGYAVSATQINLDPFPIIGA